MNLAKLIEIQAFWQVEDYTCTSCGTITDLMDIKPVFNPDNHSYAVKCDCGKHLAHLRTSKVLSIFKNTKVGMVEIEDLSRDWLKWALSVNHTAFRRQEYRDAALRRIEAIDSLPTSDFVTSKSEQQLIDDRARIKYLEIVQTELIDKKRLLLHDTEDSSYSEIQVVLETSRELGRSIGKVSGELRRLIDSCASSFVETTSEKELKLRRTKDKLAEE